MSETTILDWLNENSYRAYPLKEAIVRTSGGYKLTDDVILDAQFIYSTIPTPISLTSIVADSVNITFNISGGLVFVVSRSDIFPASRRISSGNLLVIGAGALNIPNGTYTFSNVTFELSVATEFSGAWLGVQSLQFTTSPSSAILTGNINFIEGWQFGININNPTITLSAGSIYGLPIGCTHFGNAPENCNDVISFINGVSASGGEKLTFSPGTGIVILDDPANYRIFIGLSFAPGDVCKTIVANPN